jgi:hypothetical protein
VPLAGGAYILVFHVLPVLVAVYTIMCAITIVAALADITAACFTAMF